MQPWEEYLSNAYSHVSLTGRFDAHTLEEASSILRTHTYERAKVISGGCDIVRLLKTKNLSWLPGVLVNIKSIPNMNYIKEEDGMLKIGAMTRLDDILKSELINTKYTVLAKAAGVVGTPQVRNMASIAGSLCQDVRCWYYTASKNYFHCCRKGGDNCPALAGNNRWMFSIFGSPQGQSCYATCQSDMAVVLTSLDASIKTTTRTMPAESLFTSTFPGTVLSRDEIITEVQIPSLDSDARAEYNKFSIRKSIDHPLVSVSGVSTGGEIKIVVGGVYITPYTAHKVTELLHGKKITETLSKEAGNLAVENAVPLSMNAWKVEVTKTLVKRTIMALT
jgi:xanthine dehydrogenase YagS FAD-binding subunit